MTTNEITGIVVETGLQIHKALGPGLFESVYESILTFELAARGLAVERQAPIQIVWKGMLLGEGFRADLIVEGKVIIELKSIERLAPVHKKQLLTYLRASGLHMGLLINFGAALFRDGVERIINGQIDE